MEGLPMAALAASAVAPQDPASTQDAAVAIVGFVRAGIKRAKCIHDIIEADGRTTPRGPPQSGRGFDRTSIRCP